MKANNAYENGYQNAYGVTSWALSGKKFNVADEAASEAARAVRLGDIKAADSDEFARGFIDFCREHFGDWDAYELAEGYAFRCISAEEAWNSYFWGVAGARAFHVYDDGVLVMLANYFPAGVEVGDTWACEVYMRGDFMGQGYGPTMQRAVSAALEDAAA